MNNISSKITTFTLKYLGQLIQLARKEKGMSQQDLADRLNATIIHVGEIEEGYPLTSVGMVFEAAIIVGVPLVGGDLNNTKTMVQLISSINNLIPGELPRKERPLDDNF